MEYGPVKKTTVRGHSVYKVFGVLHKCKIILLLTLYKKLTLCKKNGYNGLMC